MVNATPSFRPNKRQIVVLILLIIGLFVIVPQLDDFRNSLHRLGHPSLAWLLAAIALTVLTYLAAAGTYWMLAFKKLPYRQLVLVQLAAMFVNRLLPSGIGAVGANYAYFKNHRQTGVQAATMIGLNNLFGLLGHGLLIGLVFLAFGNQKSSNHFHGPSSTIVLLVVTVAVLVGLGVSIFARKRLLSGFAILSQQLLSYRHRPARLVGGLASSMTLTLCNVLALGCCALALGVHLSFVPTFLIFTFGVGGGAATPTPGGLGGFEAGLVGGMAAYNIDGSTALAVALLYRLVSYWLPLLVGGAAFFIAQRQKLFL